MSKFPDFVFAQFFFCFHFFLFFFLPNRGSLPNIFVLNFQTFAMFPVFPAFPVILGTKKNENLENVGR